MKLKHDVVGALVGGIAAVPALLYVYVIRPMYSVASNPAAKAPAQRAAIVHNASNATQIIFAVGGFLLLVLVVYVAVGLYFSLRLNRDLQEQE